MEIPNKWRGEILYTVEKVCGDLINDGKNTGIAEIRVDRKFFLVGDVNQMLTIKNKAD